MLLLRLVTQISIKFDKIAKTNLEKYKTAGIIVNIYGITEINQTKFNYKNNIY